MSTIKKSRKDEPVYAASSSSSINQQPIVPPSLEPSPQSKKRTRQDKVAELYAKHQHNDIYNPIIRVCRVDFLTVDEKTSVLEPKDAQLTIKSGKIRYLDMTTTLAIVAKQIRAQTKKGVVFDPVEFVNVPQDLIDSTFKTAATTVAITSEPISIVDVENTHSATVPVPQPPHHIKKEKRDKKKHKHDTTTAALVTTTAITTPNHMPPPTSKNDELDALEIDLPILGPSASALDVSTYVNKHTEVQLRLDPRSSTGGNSNTSTIVSASSTGTITGTKDVCKKVTIHTIPSREYLSTIADATTDAIVQQKASGVTAIAYPVRHDPATRSLEKILDIAPFPPPPPSPPPQSQWPPISTTDASTFTAIDEDLVPLQAPPPPPPTSPHQAPFSTLVDDTTTTLSTTMSDQFEDRSSSSTRQALVSSSGGGDKLVFNPFAGVDVFSFNAALPKANEPCPTCDRIKSDKACKTCGIDIVDISPVKVIFRDREWTPAEREEKMVLEMLKRLNVPIGKLRQPTDKLITEINAVLVQSQQHILAKCKSDDYADIPKTIERLIKLVNTIGALYVAKDNAKDELIAKAMTEKIGRMDEAWAAIEDPRLPKAQRELALAKKEAQASDATIRDQQQQIETLTQQLLDQTTANTPRTASPDTSAVTELTKELSDKERRIRELELAINQQDVRLKEYETSGANMSTLLNQITPLETLVKTQKLQLVSLEQQANENATKESTRNTKFMTLLADNSTLREAVTAEKMKTARLAEELEKETIRYATLTSIMNEYREPDKEVRKTQMDTLLAKNQETIVEFQQLLEKQSRYLLNTCFDMTCGETNFVISKVDEFSTECQNRLAPVLQAQYPTWTLGSNIAKSTREQMARTLHQAPQTQ